MAATPSGHARSLADDLGQPDLIPIMSIMCILIPMLIYSFVFFEVKVQEISLPKFNQSPNTDSNKKVLNLALLVSEDQFMIKIQGGKEPKEIALRTKNFRMCDSEKPCDQCVGEEFEDYDFPGLYGEIHKLKDKADFSAVDSINIGADNHIPWLVLARTIDSVRVRLEKPTYDTLCEYHRAKAKKVETTDADGNKITVVAEMFPKIVFVML